MHEPTVAAFMNPRVITAVPDTPFRELVGTMIAHDLDALPVIDLTGRPLGVVTDADVHAKLEFHNGTDSPPLLAGAHCRARWRKSSGATAADLMTTPAATINEHAPLTEAIHMLGTARRVYVTDHTHRLVGVLTRHDTLRLFLRSDHAIQADIERDILTPVRTAEARHLTVHVTHGIVTLEGTLTLHSTAETLYHHTHHVPGVIAVHNNLHYTVDDLLITGM